MNDSLDPDDLTAIKKTLQEGRKIDAIKLYRDASGKGLKESKMFIDALASKLVEQDPVGYAKLSRKSGCLSLVVFCLVATACLAALRSVS